MPHAVVSDRHRNRAKQLRQAMTRAETLLWRYIKANRMDGVNFRRQVPIQNYIADFFLLLGKARDRARRRVTRFRSAPSKRCQARRVPCNRRI
ncbi:DUF559 domain-containing protein [Bradyrhizobium sp. SZCCHNRI2007]|uniref:DUF559 domain-containing protein n=1 Tax=Bradyrhizobium sp. SZCCHNRI2007 TaxID=3057281 RepID=UPI0028E73CF7|nr:DUF559 domain-containing protein [Bradyrhizobium sp. SZCCHNRI2007]